MRSDGRSLLSKPDLHQRHKHARVCQFKSTTRKRGCGYRHPEIGRKRRPIKLLKLKTMGWQSSNRSEVMRTTGCLLKECITGPKMVTAFCVNREASKDRWNGQAASELKTLEQLEIVKDQSSHLVYLNKPVKI